MSNIKAWAKLTVELSLCNAGIVYSPLPGEVDPFRIPPLALVNFKTFAVPKSALISPAECAQRVVNFAGERLAFVVVPGRLFDSKGTRQGRGRGWYDRFLANLPCDWLRVGVAAAGCFSQKIIPRQEWDEVMDWIVWNSGSGSEWFTCETFARKRKGKTKVPRRTRARVA